MDDGMVVVERTVGDWDSKNVASLSGETAVLPWLGLGV